MADPIRAKAEELGGPHMERCYCVKWLDPAKDPEACTCGRRERVTDIEAWGRELQAAPSMTAAEIAASYTDDEQDYHDLLHWIARMEREARTAGVRAEFASHEAEVLELTRTQEAEVAAGRRQGAEEMRERAAKVASYYSVLAADRIRALPLDPPKEGK